MPEKDQQSTWAERIANFKASGLSVPKWCKANGIKPHQLRYRLKKEEQSFSGEATSWLPLNLSDETMSPITVRIGSIAIDVPPNFDPEHLSAVVRALIRL